MSIHKSILIVQPSAAEQHNPPDRSVERPGSTVFDKAMEQLAAMFPAYTRYIQIEICSHRFFE